ncbi:MAG: hypothetical protein IT230_09035 [Flavobacteriales bacterium]|nr:hypothetical protein [Flavobacteriales bacterium]
MLRRLLLLPCLLGLAVGTSAQHTHAGPGNVPDSTREGLDRRARHQPARAAIYSAVLPGAGQVYNRKYWKVPIVFAGLGISYWFIQDNNREFQRYKTAYLDVLNNRPDEFNGRYPADQLRNVADTYQRWRDLSYVAIGLVYALNIIDASVDGYFVRFDVGNDLALRAGPSLDLAAHGAAGLTLSLQLH